jgi:4a-hydroxytetrahydrobiopterin dehydratase
MGDPKQKLTVTEVAEAGLEDWRPVLGALRARFTTGNFATGLAFVDRIGAAAEQANHHPDVQLSYTEVLVSLRSHDVGGITARDLDLARRVSGFAAEAGIGADPAGVTTVELGLDTGDGGRLDAYYAALLGSRGSGDGGGDSGEVSDPSGQTPTVWFQEPGEDGPALPEPTVDQRWHLDVWVPADEGERRVRAVVDAGGRLVSDAAAPSYWVVEDADGNRSCVCTDLDRG